MGHMDFCCRIHTKNSEFEDIAHEYESFQKHNRQYIFNARKHTEFRNQSACFCRAGSRARPEYIKLARAGWMARATVDKNREFTASRCKHRTNHMGSKTIVYALHTIQRRGAVVVKSEIVFQYFFAIGSGLATGIGCVVGLVYIGYRLIDGRRKKGDEIC